MPGVRVRLLPTPAACLACLTLLTGCGSARAGGDQPAPGAGTVAAVRWSDYGPDVRNRIDAWAATGDCRRLGDTRDTAVAAGEAVRQRTGHGNDALVDYLDAVARSAGCPPLR